MKKAFIALAGLICVLVMGSAASAKPAALYRTIEGKGGMTVIKAGKPAVTIVMADDASPLIYFAAEEMRRYLSDICGTWQGKIEILKVAEAPDKGPRIFLHNAIKGDTPAIPLPAGEKDISREGFTLRCDGQDLYIKGTSTRGTLNGVYAFLEEIMGVRWLTGDSDGTCLPEIKDFTLPAFTDTRTPAMAYRWHPFHGMWRMTTSERHDRQMWALRNRYTHIWFYADGFTALPQPVRDELLPAGYMTVGHVLMDIYGRYKAEMDNHPDYFSLVGGKRTIDTAKKMEAFNWQFCPSSEGVRKIVADYVLETGSQNPKVSVRLSCNDGGGYCECDKCRAFPSKTDAYIDFINDICTRVEKPLPETRIAFFVYWDIEAPPKNKVKLHRNALPVICPLYFGLIHNRTIDDPASLGTSGSWPDYLSAWLPLVAQIGVYDYPCLEAPGWDGETWIFTENARLYAKTGKFIFYSTDNAGKGLSSAQKITDYAITKVLWNPDLQTDDVIRDYLRHYYGGAAEAMEAYFRVADQTYRKMRPVNAQAYWRMQLYSPELLAEMAVPLATALQAETAEPYRSRLRRVSLEFEVIKRKRENALLQRKFQYGGKDEDLNLLVSSLKESLLYLDRFTKSDYEAIAEELKSIKGSLANYEHIKEPQTTFKPGPFSYNDSSYEGGFARRDALKIEGLSVSEWGWSLPALGEGSIEYEFQAGKDHVFAGVEAGAAMYLCLPQRTADAGAPVENSASPSKNRFSISTDGGATYSVIAENKTTRGCDVFDLAGYVKGKSSFRLRWWGKNGLNENSLFWGGPNLKGTIE